MHNSTRIGFEHRIALFYMILIVVIGLLALRMVQLQWVQHEQYSLQADDNRLNTIPLLSVRGEISDRNGKPLAINQTSYQLVVIPERVKDKKKLLAELSPWFQWDEKKQLRLLRKVKKDRADRPVILENKLDWEHIAPIAARLHQFPGLDVQVGTHRYYPYGFLVSHLMGYLSKTQKKHLDMGMLASEKIGSTGLERVWESSLHGQLGNQLEEVNARGRRIQVLDSKAPVMGSHVRASIDIELQQTAAAALGERNGAVVMMDVHTGEVLVALSMPSFDNNAFIQGFSHKQWKRWMDDERHPLLNRTTQAVYPPASTFKMLTSFAGLRHAVPLSHSETTCAGYIQLKTRRLRCWNRYGHGHVDMAKALMQSCDVYFYELSKQIGNQKLHDEALMWGFGEKTGIAIPERKGSVPRVKMYQGELMIAGIGQGSVTASPLQVARFAAAIANGGKVLRPQLQAGVKPEIIRQVDVSQASLDKVRKAMRTVVSTRGGTAYRVLSDTAVSVAGKTGTAQVVAMSQKSRKAKKNQLNHHKDHAWFMGYAPYENPRIAFAVIVEHGEHGGSTAGPIAKQVINHWAEKYL
ncbi:MAG: penicillin-binding protein 2 [Mariprofundaceae bacterium]|nr:penicillin-binding protein 2 [Mariprofundaceae bacterium]